MNRRWISAAVMCCASLATAAYEAQTIKTTIGEPVRELLAKATSTEVYRLSGDYTADQDEKNWKRGRVWDAARTKEIVEKLLSDSSFIFSMRLKCEPRPGVLLRLICGTKSVDLRLCFECSIMEVSTKGPEFEKALHFDPSRAIWTRWVKEAFPDDAVIQGIKGKDMPPEEKKRLDELMERAALELEAKKAQQNREKK